MQVWSIIKSRNIVPGYGAQSGKMKNSTMTQSHNLLNVKDLTISNKVEKFIWNSVRVKERPWVPCIDILLLLIMIIDKVITKYSNETKVVTISQYFLYTAVWTKEVVLIKHYRTFFPVFYQQSKYVSKNCQK